MLSKKRYVGTARGYLEGVKVERMKACIQEVSIRVTSERLSTYEDIRYGLRLEETGPADYDATGTHEELLAESPSSSKLRLGRHRFLGGILLARFGL